MEVSRLLERCAAVGMRPARVSVMAGLSADYLRNLARGTIRDPSIRKLHAIAKVLGTNALYLAGLTDDCRPPDELNQWPATELIVEGDVSRGRWLESRVIESFVRRPSVMLAASCYRGHRQFALAVADASLERVGISQGSELHCVAVNAQSQVCLREQVVIVRRTRSDLTERSAWVAAQVPEDALVEAVAIATYTPLSQVGVGARTT